MVFVLEYVDDVIECVNYVVCLWIYVLFEFFVFE